MADFDPVTIEQFTKRFPIFADRETDQLAAVLAEANTQVDNRWEAKDYPIAIMYLMAHLLSLDASQETDAVAIGPPGAGQIVASESIGGMSVSYFNPGQNLRGVKPSFWDSTEYGRRFYRLLKANFGGPVAV